MANWKKSLAQAKRPAKGFTLAEVLVTLTLISTISMVVIGALAPWLALKQSVDNDKRLNDIRQGIYTKYNENAMAVEAQPAGNFFGLKNSTIDAAGNCITDLAGFQGLSNYITDSGAQAAKDGFGNPFCVFISNQLSTQREGTTLYYRNIAIVSPGKNGLINPKTRMVRSTGEISFHDDDVGFLVSGHEIQLRKLTETLARMSRIANTYETYFSTRFLSYPDRDITRNYFSKEWDPTGAVNSTKGSWVNAQALLSSIGVSPSDTYSAWELDNQIVVGNYNEIANGVRARSPASTGIGRLPYSALIVAQIPAPAGATKTYITRVAVGNY